ncbi:DUF6318 family protein [Blastococcus montanus]|uniref:DUF6318 family protein n=1 Tax=Blastococcus montanus TaxID=3144973 RepID=UPI003209812C
MRDPRGGPVRTILALLMLGTLALTGCSEKQEANTTLPTNAAPTTEALPPLGPPDLPMPAEAREQTAEGAQAFTEYYVEVYNHAMRSLDTSYMRDLSRECETCDQLADQVDRVAASEQEYDGGQVTIVGSTPPYLTGDEAQLVFDVKQAPLSITMDDQPIEGRSFPEHATSGGGGILHWDDARATWVMRQWVVE